MGLKNVIQFLFLCSATPINDVVDGELITVGGIVNMAMTFAEKLLAAYSGNKKVITSQIVTVHPDHLLTHDNTAAIIQKIKNELEEYGVYSKSLSIIVLDHVVPAASEKTA